MARKKRVKVKIERAAPVTYPQRPMFSIEAVANGYTVRSTASGTDTIHVATRRKAVLRHVAEFLGL